MIEETKIGERMRALARSEGHRRRLPKIAYRGGLAENEKSRYERVTDALKGGPLARKQLAAALNVSYSSAGDYLYPLIRNGTVCRLGEGVTVELFKLADQA